MRRLATRREERGPFETNTRRTPPHRDRKRAGQGTTPHQTGPKEGFARKTDAARRGKPPSLATKYAASSLRRTARAGQGDPAKGVRRERCRAQPPTAALSGSRTRVLQASSLTCFGALRRSARLTAPEKDSKENGAASIRRWSDGAGLEPARPRGLTEGTRPLTALEKSVRGERWEAGWPEGLGGIRTRDNMLTKHRLYH